MPKDRNDDERETTYSGESGERERSTPGRTPRELDLSADEVRGNTIGAGGPMGDSRSGPGQHKSTSRGDLDR